MKSTILILGSVTSHIQERMEAEFETLNCPNSKELAAVMKENGSRVAGILTSGHIPLGKVQFDEMPNLKMISCFGVGYDSTNVHQAIKAGAIVTHTPDVLNADVANTAIMLMLAVSRRLLLNDAYLRKGDWVKHGDASLTDSIENARVGIVGLGRIGLTLAKKLSAFDCHVCYHNRSERKDVPYTYYDSVVDLAKDSAYLIIVTPGGAGTENLIDRQVIDALGSDGVLINVARGSVVDEVQLVAALQQGRLGAAGLDVFAKEPHVPAELLGMTNVVLLPHTASATHQTRRAMGDLTVDNLVKFFSTGQALTPVPECQ